MNEFLIYERVASKEANLTFFGTYHEGILKPYV